MLSTISLQTLRCSNTAIQLISCCLYRCGKMKVQTDQSNVSYPEMSSSTANLIDQFGSSFFRNATSNLKSSVRV